MLRLKLSLVSTTSPVTTSASMPGPVPSATSARAGGRLGLSTMAISTRRSLLHLHPDVRGRCPSTEVEGLVCAAIMVCEEPALCGIQAGGVQPARARGKGAVEESLDTAEEVECEAWIGLRLRDGTAGERLNAIHHSLHPGE